MVVVEFDYSEFKDVFGKQKEEVIEALNKIGAPAEEDTATGKLFVEVTPNRPDWYSVAGLARAVRAYYGKGGQRYAAEKSGLKIIVDKKVAKTRPYTVGAVVRGLKLSERDVRDLVLLQEKLIFTLGRVVRRFGIGVYPADKITFPLRYTTMKPADIQYKPLNYPNEADANEIIEKHPKGQAYGHIIAKEKEYPVYLDANGKIMALIPIVNSEETGKVEASTKDIFVEVTGVDKVGIKQALNIIVCHLADLGGRIHSVDVVYGNKVARTPEMVYKKAKISKNKIKKIVGMELSENEIKENLRKMDYVVDKDIYIQPYRADIISEIDIIEDVLIGYGYEKFEATLPDFFSVGKRAKNKELLGGIMQRMGFVEVVTPILTSDEKLNEFGFKGIKVLNPKTKEYTTIRSSMLPSMMDVIIKNKMGGLPQKFYEIGKIVGLDGSEKDVLCFVVTDKCDFSIIRGYMQVLFKEICRQFHFEKASHLFFEEEYNMDVVVDGVNVGFGGKINKDIMEKNKLGAPVFIFQLEIK